MFLKLIAFFLLCSQSICYGQSVKCLDTTFGKCPKQSYCGISDTGSYNCAPCPYNNLCPGDGYTYQIRLINETNSYIVSSSRNLIGKKLKKIGKIVKVGLTIAAIAKTGGVAALKTAAAAKAKEFAIRKGIQCLKNGLSNFCNGKKKSIGKIGGKIKQSKSVSKLLKKTVAAKLPSRKTNLGKTNKVKTTTRANSKKIKTPGKSTRINNKKR